MHGCCCCRRPLPHPRVMDGCLSHMGRAVPACAHMCHVCLRAMCACVCAHAHACTAMSRLGSTALGSIPWLLLDKEGLCRLRACMHDGVKTCGSGVCHAVLHTVQQARLPRTWQQVPLVVHDEACFAAPGLHSAEPCPYAGCGLRRGVGVGAGAWVGLHHSCFSQQCASCAPPSSPGPVIIQCPFLRPAPYSPASGPLPAPPTCSGASG